MPHYRARTVPPSPTVKYDSRTMFEDIRVLMIDWGGTIVRVARQDEIYDRCIDAGMAALAAANLTCPANAKADLYARLVKSITEAEDAPELVEFDSRAFLTAWANDHRIGLPDGQFPEHLLDAFWRPWIGCLDVMGRGAETLERLAGAGYVLGLVSNCAVPPHLCRVELEREGIARHFAFPVFSSEVGYRKPDARIFRRALALARAHLPALAPEQVLFVGDTPDADIDGSRAHGFRTALVRTGHWDGAPEAITCSPDVILDSIDSLLEVLEGCRRDELRVTIE